MISPDQADAETEPIWQFVPLADYAPPAVPVPEKARRGLAELLRRFRQEEPEPDAPVQQEDLHGLSRWQVDQIAPAPDWEAAAEALGVQLGHWLDRDEPVRPVLVLVGPPQSGHAEILEACGAQRGWSELPAPTADQVLAGDDAWLSRLTDSNSPWIFPHLEKTYLRHATGLDLVRRFLDRAHAGRFGRGIIGCDCWAWAYLRHVGRGREGETWALQAFDQARLERYLRRIASAHPGPLVFRHPQGDQVVWAPPDTDPGEVATSPYLELLAAHSRGILGVAWAIWRASLLAESDDPQDEPEEQEGQPPSYQTIWVRPWDELGHPSLPGDAGQDEAFVLHTLLLHGGLPAPLLPQLLPLSTGQVTATLFRLEEAGLVAQQGAAWQVTPTGYPAVRQFLQTGGYLVDQF